MNLRPLIPSILICAAALSSAGCNSAPGKPGPGPAVSRPDQLLDFSTLYAQNCAACHGENGKNGAAISLANPVYLAFAGVPNIQRVTSIGVSGTAMPPFARSAGGMLTDRQIAVLTTGMQQHWGDPSVFSGRGNTPPPYAATAPGDPARGQQAFTTFCARCHGADGTGGKSPHGESLGSLVDPAYLALISDQGLRSIIIAGQTGQDAHDWRSYYGPEPGLAMADRQVTDVVAWLASHRIATPGQPYQQPSDRSQSGPVLPKGTASQASKNPALLKGSGSPVP